MINGAQGIWRRNVRPPQQKMRLDGMGHHYAGAVCIDDILELWQNTEIETAPLRNDFHSQTKVTGSRHEFLWRIALAPFKGHDTAFDSWKLCSLITKFICRAMELQNVLGDGIDRCRFDQGKHPEV